MQKNGRRCELPARGQTHTLDKTNTIFASQNENTCLQNSLYLSLLFLALWSSHCQGGGQVLYKKDGVMKYCQFSGFICDEKSQRKDHQKTKHRPYFALAKKLPIQLEKNTNMFCKMMNFPIIFPNQIPCIFFPYTFPVFFSSKFGSCNFCLQDKELTKKNLKMRSTKFLLQGN